jgi:ATP-dependent RNA helicase RhlE
VSLVAQDEAPLLRDIERLLRRPIPVAPLPEFVIPAEPAQSQGAGHARHDGPRQHGAQPGHNGPRHPGSQQRRSGGRHRGRGFGQRSRGA